MLTARRGCVRPACCGNPALSRECLRGQGRRTCEYDPSTRKAIVPALNFTYDQAMRDDVASSAAALRRRGEELYRLAKLAQDARVSALLLTFAEEYMTAATRITNEALWDRPGRRHYYGTAHQP